MFHRGRALPVRGHGRVRWERAPLPSLDTYVSSDLHSSGGRSTQGHRRAPASGDPAAGVVATELPATDIADRFPDVTRPGDLPAPHRAQGRRPRDRAPRRGPAASTGRTTQTMAELRAFLDDYWTSGLERLRDVAEADRPDQRPRKDTLMAELVREIMIDATPETIWPFLIEPEQARRVDRAPSPTSTRVRAASTVCSSAARTSRRASTSRWCPTRRWSFTFGWEQDGNPITARLEHRRDHAAPRGRQDAASGSCTAASRRRRHRPHPWLGPLPRPPRDRGRPAATPVPTSAVRPVTPDSPEDHR